MSTSSSIHYRLYSVARPASADQSHQVLELRLRYIRRPLISAPPAGILHETPPPRLKKALFHLSLRQLQDPLSYVKRWLSSLNIRSAACEVIARHIASYIMQTAGGNRDTNFHIVAEIDHIRLITSMEDEDPIPGLYSTGGAPVEEKAVSEEAPPESVRKEKLEENENGEELGDCSICLDEMNCNCKKKEVIKIPCGHAYHHSCISKWLEGIAIGGLRATLFIFSGVLLQ